MKYLPLLTRSLSESKHYEGSQCPESDAGHRPVGSRLHRSGQLAPLPVEDDGDHLPGLLEVEVGLELGAAALASEAPEPAGCPSRCTGSTCSSTGWGTAGTAARPIWIRWWAIRAGYFRRIVATEQVHSGWPDADTGWWVGRDLVAGWWGGQQGAVGPSDGGGAIEICFEGVAVVVDPVVMEAAQQDQARDGGLVGCMPRVDVVGMRPGRRPVAAREDAALVSHGQGPTLAGVGAAGVTDLTDWVELAFDAASTEHRIERRIGRQFQHLLQRHHGAISELAATSEQFFGIVDR